MLAFLLAVLLLALLWPLLHTCDLARTPPPSEDTASAQELAAGCWLLVAGSCPRVPADIYLIPRSAHSGPRKWKIEKGKSAGGETLDMATTTATSNALRNDSPSFMLMFAIALSTHSVRELVIQPVSQSGSQSVSQLVRHSVSLLVSQPVGSVFWHADDNPGGFCRQSEFGYFAGRSIQFCQFGFTGSGLSFQIKVAFH